MLMSMEGHGKKGHCCAFHHQFRTANQQCKSCKQNLFVYADGAKRSTARHPTAPWRCRRSLRISCQVQHADLPQTASVPPRGKEGNRDIKQGTHHHFVVCLFFLSLFKTQYCCHHSLQNDWSPDIITDTLRFATYMGT